jgi:putative endonuclease
MPTHYVYILTNVKRNVMYVGVTNNLENRVAEHRSGKGGAFTRQYRVNTLVYAEEYQYVEDAIVREKEIKGWRRSKKDALVAASNPTWADLLEAGGVKGPSLRAHMNAPTRDDNFGLTQGVRHKHGVIPSAARDLCRPMPTHYVYILTNVKRNVMYVGVTNNLENRGAEHRSRKGGAFTLRYRVNTLVYAEQDHYIEDAIVREKEIKGWRRSKKDALVAASNPGRTAASASISIPTSGTRARSRPLPPAATSTSRARCMAASVATSRASWA